MSSTHATLPDLARVHVAQRLRDADDARRRRLARRTGRRGPWRRSGASVLTSGTGAGHTARPAATRSSGRRRAELSSDAISG